MDRRTDERGEWEWEVSGQVEINRRTCIGARDRLKVCQEDSEIDEYGGEDCM